LTAVTLPMILFCDPLLNIVKTKTKPLSKVKHCHRVLLYVYCIGKLTRHWWIHYKDCWILKGLD